MGTAVEDSPAYAWIHAVEESCEELGVTSNVKKAVDGNDDAALIQGAMIHSTEHWIGTDWQRRLSTAVCTVLALARKRVSYKYVEKLVGKH